MIVDDYLAYLDLRGETKAITIEGAGEAHWSLHDRAQLEHRSGSISHLNVHDSGSILVEGADISHLYIRDNSRVTSGDGASVSHINLLDNGFAKIGPGSDISHLVLTGSATAEVRDTDISHINLFGDNRILIDGGNISHLGVRKGSEAIIFDVGNITWLHMSGGLATIYGYDLDVFDGGVSGFSRDGTAFNVGTTWLFCDELPCPEDYGSAALTLIDLRIGDVDIPAPPAFGLMGLGLLLFGARRAQHVSSRGGGRLRG